MKVFKQTHKLLVSGRVFLLCVFFVLMCKTRSSVCQSILHTPCALEKSEKRCRWKYFEIRVEGGERETDRDGNLVKLETS
jgi:hypothetical protein